MIHDHNHTKTVGIREFQQNIYNNLPKPGESTLVTNRGQAMFCVSSLAMPTLGAATLKGANDENDSELHTG